MSRDQLFFVIDVESIGLHGDGFAVGVVVVNGAGETLEEKVLSCPPDNANGGDDDRRWVAEHVPALEYDFAYPGQVRSAFAKLWSKWRERGAAMVADCAWPVEAGFLRDCVEFEYLAAWEGPYPLLDLSSILLAAGKDPTGTYHRTERELPRHHPLNDARQTARILIDTLRMLDLSREKPPLYTGVESFGDEWRAMRTLLIRLHSARVGMNDQAIIEALDDVDRWARDTDHGGN